MPKLQHLGRRGERRRLSPLARLVLTLSLVGVFAGALAVFSPEAPAVKQPQILTTNASTVTESVALATELSLTTAEEAAATEASAAATGTTGTATLSALASTTAASSNAASTTAASSNAASTTAAASNAASTTAAASNVATTTAATTATTGTTNGNGAATTGTTTGTTAVVATLLTSTAVVRPSFFSATRTKRTVLLRWRTESEAETLGFNIYRAQGAKRVRVNGRLIAARGGSGGRAYSYRHVLPSRISGSLRYWLQIVHTDGSRSWHGPITARA